MTEARQRNLLRFIHAQDSGGIYENTSTFSEALQKIKKGYKKSHWMWYIFPQMKGLGKSEFSGNIKDTLIAGKIKEEKTENQSRNNKGYVPFWA